MRSSVRTNHHRMAFSGYFPIIFLLLTAQLAAGQTQTGPRNEPYDYGRLSPAMAVIVVILIAALFFMGFFSLYFRHCSGVPDVGATPTTVGARSTAVARGLDASLVDTFPTFVYSEVKTQKLGKEELECAICLNEFEDDETLRLLPKCDHVFHPHCIGAWLEAHVTCPVCRSNLAEQTVIESEESVEPERTEPDLELQPVSVNPEPVVNAPAESEIDSSRLPGVPVDLKRAKLPRSHTTGHSVVQPGECTERFTLRLPENIRKKVIAEWRMNRSSSILGSSRSGKPMARSDRWLFRKTPSFMWRNRNDGSIRLGRTGSVRSNAVSNGDSVRSDRWAFLRNPSALWRNTSVHVPGGGANKDGEGTSVKSTGAGGGSVRLPV